MGVKKHGKIKAKNRFTGELRYFQNIQEAVRKGFNASKIYKALNHLKLHKNCLWTYEDQEFPEIEQLGRICARNEYLGDQKYCKSCDKMKNKAEFSSIKKENREQLSVYCRKCDYEKGDDYRKSNKEKIAEGRHLHYEKNQVALYEKNRERILTNKERAINFLGGECADCSLTHIHGINSCLFDFHHKDPNEKEFAMAGTFFSRSLENVLLEAKKCTLLCANCHRLRHKHDRELISNLRKKKKRSRRIASAS